MIDIQHFTKVYDRFLAVRDLSFRVAQGEICGFIGPNGAGKTTTMRFLATLLRPTLGRAHVNGFDVARQPVDVRRSIGFMPDTFGVYDGMRVAEYLDFFATAYGIALAARRRIIADVLALVDLEQKAETEVNLLSRGMKQRLGLARTLVHDPPVLILDEPASGLDPRARVEVKELLRELQRMGKTILISSHILSELADICTQLAVIEKGSLVAFGSLAEILRRVREKWMIELEVLSGVNEALAVLHASPRARHPELLDQRICFEFTGIPQELSALLRQMVEADVKLLWCKEVEVNLEQAFMRITRGEVS
jgi:ABC-2 type transport system ATP-binding protein